MKAKILTGMILFFVVVGTVAAQTLTPEQRTIQLMSARLAQLETWKKQVEPAMALMSQRLAKLEDWKKNLKMSTTASGHDTQARRIGNRALAWALYPQLVGPTNIEEVEAFLSPLERGNMKPDPFEAALKKAMQVKKWKFKNGLSVSDIARFLLENHLDKIRGPRGPKGDRGPQGLQGPRGRDGRDGRDVDPSVLLGLQNQIDNLTTEVSTKADQQEEKISQLRKEFGANLAELTEVLKEVLSTPQDVEIPWARNGKTIPPNTESLDELAAKFAALK